MYWSYTQESGVPAELERMSRYEENVIRLIVVLYEEVNGRIDLVLVTYQ